MQIKMEEQERMEREEAQLRIYRAQPVPTESRKNKLCTKGSERRLSLPSCIPRNYMNANVEDTGTVRSTPSKPPQSSILREKKPDLPYSSNTPKEQVNAFSSGQGAQNEPDDAGSDSSLEDDVLVSRSCTVVLRTPSEILGAASNNQVNKAPLKPWFVSESIGYKNVIPGLKSENN